jgi:hypothetical protein
MKFREGGNGSGKSLAHRSPLRPGWVKYHAGDPPPADHLLPEILGGMLEADLLENPLIVVEHVLPVVKEGSLSAIYLWYRDTNAPG